MHMLGVTNSMTRHVHDSCELQRTYLNRSVFKWSLNSLRDRIVITGIGGTSVILPFFIILLAFVAARFASDSHTDVNCITLGESHVADASRPNVADTRRLVKNSIASGMKR